MNGSMDSLKEAGYCLKFSCKFMSEKSRKHMI